MTSSRRPSAANAAKSKAKAPMAVAHTGDTCALEEMTPKGMLWMVKGESPTDARGSVVRAMVKSELRVMKFGTVNGRLHINPSTSSP